MLISFNCSDCNASLEIDGDSAGSEVACPECGASLIVPRKRVGPGTTVGGFKVERLLGKGGMGEVYLARQLSMDRDVALKILPSNVTMDEEAVQRFLQEVRMAARLEHPHIVRAYEAGEDSGVYFLAMTYVRGDSLGDLLEGGKPATAAAPSSGRSMLLRRPSAKAARQAERDHTAPAARKQARLHVTSTSPISASRNSSAGWAGRRHPSAASCGGCWHTGARRRTRPGTSLANPDLTWGGFWSRG